MNISSRLGRLLNLLYLFSIPVLGWGQVELRYEDNYSLTYEEAIQAYEELDRSHEEAKLLTYGMTDVGKPLQLFIISASGEFDADVLKSKDKAIVLILNGIHPGESCGIDASVELSRDILRNKDGLHSFLDNTVLCIVPVYNIGGALNRSAYHRTNMDPPVEAGFRGNAQNLDLNRDFIKLDTRNTWSFVELYREWDPDVFLDNHVTNGSDHQYTITLINSVIERLDPGLGKFLEEIMLPDLYESMKDTPYEMTPYVHYLFRSPDRGIAQPNDPPRFSAGYTALFNSLSFLNETHVYKPFADQVKGSYHFMRVLFEFTSLHAADIIGIRENARTQTTRLSEYSFDWEIDSSMVDKIYFKGYAYRTKTSKLTGQSMNYYDRNEPWESEISYLKTYKAGITVPVPDYFIIPQAWTEVIKRLKWNGIEMYPLAADSMIDVDMFYIEDIEHSLRPSNGHFAHQSIKLKEESGKLQFYSGDMIIPSRQAGKRYLMETLDPRAEDSFLKWNFFDPILDRREYIDPSRFEKWAVEILANDPELKKGFEKWKTENPESAAISYYQLQFIYTHSEWAEQTHRRYPVYRISP